MDKYRPGPNRLYTKGGAAVPAPVTLTLPCSATGSVTLKVTAASGSRATYQTASMNLPVDASCGACR
ncbi:hypothetical protein HaLaN_10280 [Haematococcus lacustris]|uniref:Uncharacterized protein n=1 Tax=Haematococcus lacustris TaxID=44745 RepID=A0A699Z4H0_HAELA|nr:hypothetical protein HaLaN_10280 [Haematococcus lacustris]